MGLDGEYDHRADVMTTACSNCHDKYREVPDRCK
jgi:hypothetical protein